MKKLILLLIILFVSSIVFAGCSFNLFGTRENNNENQAYQQEAEESEDNQNNQEDETTEQTYTVSILLNDSSRGSMIIDNLKTSYEYGDVINIEINPNYGCYLRNYSDMSDNLLRRQIVVTSDINITVNLEEGESCNFYGYKIARNCSKSFDGLAHKQGNVSSLLKFENYKSITTGELNLFINDSANFGTIVLKNSSNQKMFSNISQYGSISLTQSDITNTFGEPNDEWIDIIEYDTKIGYAYYTRGTGEVSPNDCSISTGKLQIQNFNGNLFYLYKLDDIVTNFSDQENNLYLQNVGRDNNKTIYIREFKLFKFNDEVYYSTNSFVYMVNKSSNKEFNVSIDGENYILRLCYA